MQNSQQTSKQEFLSDNELIAGLKQGNSNAFDKIFYKYSGKLYGFALRYLKSEADAEELVHNVFVKIWEKRNSINQNTSFQSYIFTITYNDILKFFRNKNYYTTYAHDIKHIKNSSDQTSERIEYASLIEYIETLIDQLPEKRKQIFLKSRKEGKSSKEIAKELNMSPGSIDNHISEALKFIKTHIKEESKLACLLILFFLF